MTARPDYFEQLVLLQPPGLALPQDANSDWGRLLQGLALEPERIEGRAADLVRESDPRATVELLEDWERAYGLPDPCMPAGATLQERRAALLKRITDIGRQDLVWYAEIAAMLGYDVDIEEYHPFVCGQSECGGQDVCGPEETRYWWNMTIYGPRLVLFRCGESMPCERLGDWQAAEDLECMIRRNQQAHTLVTFTYLEDWRKP